MKHLLEMVLGNKFYDANDGGDGPIKFGGVEVDLGGTAEEIKAQVLAAQKSYTSSSDAGIKSANDLKAAQAKFDTDLLAAQAKGNAGGDVLTAADVQKLIADSMKGVNEVADRGRALNLERSIEKSSSALRQEYSFLDDATFKEVMKSVDDSFKNQDSTVRSGAMYANIAKVKLSDALVKNLNTVNEEQAMKTIMDNPELKKKFLENYSKEAGIDINMPQGGYTDQATFDTKLASMQDDFAKERNPEKRKALVQQIAQTRAEGKSMNFKL